ncbi:MAG: hypothetical protein LC808_42245 [Actinobacteria bacterium]|nr:hypothetical protein [Actinomycetota bacterium]
MARISANKVFYLVRQIHQNPDQFGYLFTWEVELCGTRQLDTILFAVHERYVHPP